MCVSHMIAHMIGVHTDCVHVKNCFRCVMTCYKYRTFQSNSLVVYLVASIVVILV